MKKLIVVLAVTFLNCISLLAQDKPEPFNRWEIGVNGGVGSFAGEYNMLKDNRFTPSYGWNSKGQFGFGASLKKNFNQVFALELAWNNNTLTGSANGLSSGDFKSLANEYDLNTVWNLNNLLSKNKFDRKFYLYAKLGLGATHVNNVTGPNSGDKNLEIPTIPLGTGVSVRVNESVRVNVGTQWSWVNSDRLDGHSTVSSPGNTKPGAVAPQIYGTKLYTYAGISIRLGKKKKRAPEVEMPRAIPKQEPKPEPKPEPKAASVEKPAVLGNIYKVYFAFDKWKVDNKASADLDKLIKDLVENPSVKVSVKSHTDSWGPASYNMKLSEKRGKAVIEYLVSKGISSSRVDAQAYGESMPVNKCADGVPCSKAEHALNRRTETIVIE